jgi:hypothetical protein
MLMKDSFSIEWIFIIIKKFSKIFKVLFKIDKILKYNHNGNSNFTTAIFKNCKETKSNIFYFSIFHYKLKEMKLYKFEISLIAISVRFSLNLEILVKSLSSKL